MAFALCLMLPCAWPVVSPAAVRIEDDHGGRIGTYMQRFRALRDSGENVIVDGDCVSACTLLLGYIPRDRICVTRKARFGFHTAWKPGFLGFHTFNEAGTAILVSRYPAGILDWLARHGGLSDRMIYLSGSELTAFYNRCR
jgi:hypothetical protein